MSGIAGIIHFDGRPVEPGLIEGMTSAMGYRGPDGIAHWRDGSVALGQCMLRTTPESLEETQPLANEDASLVLVMDGRVDNWEELRRELLARGAVLRDRSDAELVLRAFESWGPDCLEHIDGDFALAIWNARTRELFCARDRIGNKPFYYHWNGRSFAFASDLHPILALPWVEHAPNEGMIADFLAAEWHARDETVWESIRRLVQAHRMTVNGASLRTECYWQPDLWQTLPLRTDRDYIEHYRELLFDTVRRMSRTHRPLAFEVSGGLDSSAVIGVAEHLRRASRLPAPSIAGYTLGFSSGDGDAYEVEYACSVGEHLGIPIQEVPPSSLPLSWHAEYARTFRDIPGYPHDTMCMGLRQTAANHGSRAVMSGQGGDEWTQGCREYYAEELSQGHWRNLLDCFRTDAAASGVMQAGWWFVRHGVAPLLPAGGQDVLRRLSYAVRGTGPSERYWLSPAMHARIVRRRRLDPSHARTRVRSVVQRRLLDELDAGIRALMDKTERLYAQAGIELRSPLNDHRMIQFAFSTPERLRLRGNTSKFIHVQSLHDILPQSVLQRNRKSEFSVVFRAYLDRMQGLLTRDIPAHRPDWVSAGGMERLYRTYAQRRGCGWPMWALWSIYACDTIWA